MQSPVALELVDDLIRNAVRTAHYPASRLLDIARDAIATEQSAEAAWQLAELEGDQAKPLIEKRSGPPLSSKEVGDLLNVSDETVRARWRQNGLIGYEALRGKGLRFPMWQFEEGVRQRFTKARLVHSWVPGLIEAYGHNGWGLVDFLTVPRSDHNGMSYHALLRTEGGPAQVIEAARRANRD